MTICKPVGAICQFFGDPVYPQITQIYPQITQMNTDKNNNLLRVLRVSILFGITRLLPQAVLTRLRVSILSDITRPLPQAVLSLDLWH
ncbi:MAG: hypothetical protein ACRD4L_03570 [Pyrinomonadaceae bacterium]